MEKNTNGLNKGVHVEMSFLFCVCDVIAERVSLALDKNGEPFKSVKNLHLRSVLICLFFLILSSQAKQ